jgi:hypothetical protein
MTNLASAAPTRAVRAKEARRAILGTLAMLTVGVGVSVGFVYSQFGPVHFAPTLAKELAKFSPARYQAGLEQSLQQLARIEAVSRNDGPVVSVANSAR